MLFVRGDGVILVRKRLIRYMCHVTEHYVIFIGLSTIKSIIKLLIKTDDTNIYKESYQMYFYVYYNKDSPKLQRAREQPI